MKRLSSHSAFALLFCLALAALVPISHSSAAPVTQYYLSLSGNDTNNGQSAGSAWASFDHVCLPCSVFLPPFALSPPIVFDVHASFIEFATNNVRVACVLG